MEIRILETALYATDLVAAEHFYTSVFDFKVYEKHGDRHVFFRLGNSMLLIFNPETTTKGGKVPPHGATGPGHVAFAINTPDFDAWRKKLAANNVSIEKEVDWEEGSHSIYFRDPAGNSLELTTPKTWNIE